MSWRATFLLLAVLSLAAAKYRRYDGHRVYRVVPSKGHHLDLLNKLAHENKKEITFWKAAYVTNKPADVMVSPQVKNSFLAALKKNGVKYSVLVEDVQKLIDKQRPTGAAGGKFSWDDYYPLEDVYKWIKSLPAKYPGIVTTVVGGYSYENREIVGVNISFGTNRPIVVLEGTIHAREWISTAAVTWMLNQILTSTNSTVRSIVDQFNYYILPVYNPDGYKYTFTDDRMWRKTLQPHLPCMGADPNRNWDHRWSEEGASNNPCDGKYHGPRAFSEIEIRTVSKFLASLGRDLQLYMAFHSYSQLLMYPYGSFP
uniref:Zinc carboxypeptidase A 1 n=1 Tax=Melanoplus sanguinipes TaxID=65742 RepID=A0A0U3KDM7_MELSA|nr:zinc carboxypeptidase a 1-like protein [Melanoplus sanguinipes]